MTLGVPNYFTPGQFPIDSDQVNANFQAIVDYVNGLSIPTTPVSIANGGTGSTTPSAALTALGLASGTIIPGTVAYSTSGSNGTLTFTGSSAAPAVSDYALGNFYAFQVPVGTTAAPSNLYFIDATTAGSGLGAVQVYDNPGFSPTGTLISDQIMVLAFEPVADTFVLLNPPPVANTLRFAYYTSGSNTLTVPPGVSTMYATGAGPGGGGGACQGVGVSGGGGGGGGASGIGVPFSVTAGHTLVVNIGAGGAGGTSGAGSNGGTTTIVDISTSTTLISWAGGQGGGSTSGTSAVSGGTGGTPVGGGTAGSSGQSGDYYATAPLSYGGAGGSSLLTTGASSTASGGGQTNTGITSIGAGAGGSGGAGGSANGGAGGPGLMHLQW